MIDNESLGFVTLVCKLGLVRGSLSGFPCQVKNNITVANASKASKVANSSSAHHAHSAAHGAAHSVESVESVESDSDCHTALPHEPCYEAVAWRGKWMNMETRSRESR